VMGLLISILMARIWPMSHAGKLEGAAKS